MLSNTPKTMKWLTAVLMLTSCAFGAESADKIQIQVSLDTTQFLIGDWIPLHIKVIHSPQTEVFPPPIPETMGDLHILNWETLPPAMEGAYQVENWRLTLAAYDTGKFTIPPLEIACRQEGDSLATSALSDSLEIYIMSAGGDTLSQMHDIKPPLKLAWELADYLPYIILTLAVIILAALVYWYWKRKKSKPQAEIEGEEVKIQIEPYQLAMRRLVELEAKQLWQKGLVKEFFSELTEIVREYIEGEFNIPALEMTSEELVKILEGENIVPLKDSVPFFGAADLVKFAKFIPAPDNCGEALKEAYGMVKKIRYALLSRRTAQLETASENGD